jgi:hypothetical protein
VLPLQDLQRARALQRVRDWHRLEGDFYFVKPKTAFKFAFDAVHLKKLDLIVNGPKLLRLRSAKFYVKKVFRSRSRKELHHDSGGRAAT